MIGSTFVWILGLGVLFLSLFTTGRATTNSTAGVSVLFGSIFGLDHERAMVAVVIALPSSRSSYPRIFRGIPAGTFSSPTAAHSLLMPVVQWQIPILVP